MAQRFLLLSCEEQTKKIQLPENLTSDFINGEILNKFNLSGQFHSQYYDSDVSEWIDLDSVDGIEFQRILKVRVTKKNLQPSHVQNDTESVQQLQDPATPDRSTSSAPRPTTPGPSSSRPTCTTPRSTASSPVVFNESSSSSDKKIWPRMYCFPVHSFPHGLKTKLDSCQPLERIDRSRLLDVIYADVSQFENGLYPSPELYDQIVDALLRQYHYLIQVSGVPLQSCRVYWKEKLKYKWGNERKSRDKHVPEVMARKRKRQNNTGESSQTGRNVKLTWGMANFLPNQPESEDDAAVELHKQWLQQEYIKTEQIPALVDLKMNLTFPARRKAVVTELVPPEELLLQYPFLKEREQIIKEFARLAPNGRELEIQDLFYDGLDKYSVAINSLTKTKEHLPEVKEVRDQLVLLRTEGERKYACQCTASVSCCTLFKEKIEKLLFFPHQDATSAPIALLVKDKLLTMDIQAFELQIDQKTIFKCDTFIELFTGFLAAVYCFNLAYPKEMTKTLTFFQNVFLNLNDEGRLDKKIVSVVTELNKEKQKKTVKLYLICFLNNDIVNHCTTESIINGHLFLLFICSVFLLIHKMVDVAVLTFLL